MINKKIIFFILLGLVMLGVFSFAWFSRRQKIETQTPAPTVETGTPSVVKTQEAIDYSDEVMGLLINKNTLTVEAKMFEETDLVQSNNLIISQMKKLGIQNPESYYIRISGPRDYSQLQEVPPELIDKTLDAALKKKQSAP